MAADDITELRKEVVSTVRDNVVFELGLFIGRLGVERCFLVCPRGAGGLHLPTDLLGLTPVEYDPVRRDGNLEACLGPASSRMRSVIKSLGSRTEVPVSSPTSETKVESMFNTEQKKSSGIGSSLGKFGNLPKHPNFEDGIFQNGQLVGLVSGFTCEGSSYLFDHMRDTENFDFTSPFLFRDNFLMLVSYKRTIGMSTRVVNGPGGPKSVFAKAVIEGVRCVEELPSDQAKPINS
jgi:hypothetical protein